MIRAIIVDDEVLAGVGIQSLIDGQEDISVSGVFSLPEEAISERKCGRYRYYRYRDGRHEWTGTDTGSSQ